MPLTAGTGTSIDNMEERIIFYQEAYYWVMSDELQEFFNDTGKAIDLLENTLITPAELPALEKMLKNVRTRVTGKPDEWETFLATEICTGAKDLYITIKKAEFLPFLGQLDALVAEAKQKNTGIVFKSDNPITPAGTEIHIR